MTQSNGKGSALPLSPRIRLPGPEEMSPEQLAVFESVVAGRRGRVVGPLRAAIHNPELADRWQKLGEILRYRTSLPRRLAELAILVTARRWNSEVEWVIHSRDAREAGLDPSIISAILHVQLPDFPSEEERSVYAYTQQLQAEGQVTAQVHRAIVDRWGERGVVELTALIGYYTMVSMTLNAHVVPLPDDMEAELHVGGTISAGLTDIPAIPGI